MTRRQVVSTRGAPNLGLPYSQAVRHGDLVFVAGQIAADPTTGQPVEGDIRVQTRRVLDNIAAILAAAGTSLEHSVDSLCFLEDITEFDAFNEAYRAYFPENGPPRTTVQATMPRKGFKVEIRIVAAMPDEGQSGEVNG